MNTFGRQRGFAFVVFAVIVAIILALAVLLTAWYAVNIRDQRLEPGIDNALQQRHDAMPPQDNLFFALLAFDSSGTQNINQQGQAIYAANLALPVAREAFVGVAASLCGGRGKPEDCIDRAGASPQDLRKLITDNRLFLDRYAAVARYTRLQNPMQRGFNSPTASWSPFILGKRLFLTDIALQVVDGEVDQAVTRLSSDITYTRRLLAEPDILVIDKMILAASLVDSLEVVSDVVRTHRLSDGQYAQLSSTLVPLSDEERSLVGPMLRDFEAFAATIRDLMDPRNTAGLISSSPSAASRLGGELSRHFIKYNSTLNAQWHLVSEKIALSNGGCRIFQAGAAAFNSHGTESLAKVLYNPIGNGLSSIAAPDGIQYMQALCDLDGMIRIVELQLQTHLQRIHDDQLAQFARTGGARYANPFTGEPMRIDAARRTIDFQPLAERDRFFFPWPLGVMAE